MDELDPPARALVAAGVLPVDGLHVEHLDGGPLCVSGGLLRAMAVTPGGTPPELVAAAPMPADVLPLARGVCTGPRAEAGWPQDEPREAGILVLVLGEEEPRLHLVTAPPPALAAALTTARTDGRLTAELAAWLETCPVCAHGAPVRTPVGVVLPLVVRPALL
jgi:hypothetical protein